MRIKDDIPTNENWNPTEEKPHLLEIQLTVKNN